MSFKLRLSLFQMTLYHIVVTFIELLSNEFALFKIGEWTTIRNPTTYTQPVS